MHDAAQTFAPRNARWKEKPVSGFPEDERALVQACLDGDEQAWRRLFAYAFPLAVRVARGKFRLNAADAEEVGQWVLQRLANGALERYRGEGSFEGFIKAMAWCETMNLLRERNAKGRGGHYLHVSLDAPESPAACRAQSGVSPQQAAEARELVEQLRSALRRVGEPCREMIERHYLHEQSYAWIAQDLNLPEGTVASRLSRCLRKLVEMCPLPPVDDELMELLPNLIQEELCRE